MRCFDTRRPMRVAALREPASNSRSSLTKRGVLAALLGHGAGRARYLHDAHRLYTEMGATGHAERITKEVV